MPQCEWNIPLHRSNLCLGIFLYVYFKCIRDINVYLINDKRFRVSSLNNIFWISLDHFLQSIHNSKLWKQSFGLLLNKPFDPYTFLQGIYNLLSCGSWLCKSVSIQSVCYRTLHKIQILFVPSPPPGSVAVQCCQTAKANHALFLFITESEGVSDAGLVWIKRGENIFDVAITTTSVLAFYP